MNIFVLDEDPEKCARYHCDKHVVKMILESAQMLSTTLRLRGINQGYKITHQNHPCTLWAGESLSNWNWLRELSGALNHEYRFRYDKNLNHKSYDLIHSLPVPKIRDQGLTPFAQAMPERFKHDNPVIAYRKYYLEEKSAFLNWTRREKPYWVRESELRLARINPN
jgi:hypothetical protein